MAPTGIGETMFGCSAVHLQGGRAGCTRLIGSTHLPGLGARDCPPMMSEGEGTVMLCWS